MIFLTSERFVTFGRHITVSEEITTSFKCDHVRWSCRDKRQTSQKREFFLEMEVFDIFRDGVYATQIHPRVFFWTQSILKNIFSVAKKKKFFETDLFSVPKT